MQGDARDVLRMILTVGAGAFFCCCGIYCGMIRRRLPLNTGKVLEGTDAALGGLALVIVGALLVYTSFAWK